jgi:hypothetical protein
MAVPTRRSGMDVRQDVATRVPTLASLPERLALDISVAHLEQNGSGPALVLTDSAAAVTEALSRLTCPVTIAVPTNDLARDAAGIIGSGIHPSPDTIRVSTTDAFDGRAQSPIEKVLWFKPTESTLNAGIALIETTVAPTAAIAVIGVGPLDRWRVTARRERGHRSARRTDPFIVGSRLGYATEQEWRVLGLRSAARAPVRIIAAKLGRWDVADRMEATYRLALIESGKPALWAIGVWIGRRSTAIQS